MTAVTLPDQFAGLRRLEAAPHPPERPEMGVSVAYRKREVTGDDIEKVFYAGCWVRAIVNPFQYSNSGNKGISFGLQGVQFVRDDNPFTGGVSEDDWDDLPESDLAPEDLDDLE